MCRCLSRYLFGSRWQCSALAFHVPALVLLEPLSCAVVLLQCILRHFDARDSSVIATTVALRKLQAAQVQIELPDLQETLDALRKLRLPRAKGSA